MKDPISGRAKLEEKIKPAKVYRRPDDFLKLEKDKKNFKDLYQKLNSYF